MLLESRYLIYFFVYENPRDPREPVGRESWYNHYIVRRHSFGIQNKNVGSDVYDRLRED